MNESVAAGQIGVLLVNLGTPEAPTPGAVRNYLREFLSDRRVIENQGLLWDVVLNCIVLPLRPRAKAKAYEKIWNKDAGESPLKTITRAQAEKLSVALAAEFSNVRVDWAMRYGLPPISDCIKRLRAQGCDRILVVPLYPQYAASTTATVVDRVFRTLTQMRAQPTVRIAHPYYNDPIYIEALADSVKASISGLPEPPEVIIASFHGIPKEYADRGDPYPEQCAETARLLRERLGLSEDKFMLTFQSRFGPTAWLQPYTDKTVGALARQGVRRVALVMPGFSADCLETLEEIAMENAEIFRESGGEVFSVVPCLNDSAGGMATIVSVVKRELQGWV